MRHSEAVSKHLATVGAKLPALLSPMAVVVTTLLADLDAPHRDDVFKDLSLSAGGELLRSNLYKALQARLTLKAVAALATSCHNGMDLKDPPAWGRPRTVRTANPIIHADRPSPCQGGPPADPVLQTPPPPLVTPPMYRSPPPGCSANPLDGSANDGRLNRCCRAAPPTRFVAPPSPGSAHLVE